MNAYRLADIQAGKVRTASFHDHGFYLEMITNKQGNRSTISGTHLSEAEKQALMDYRVPTFNFPNNTAENLPIMKGPETDALPWGSSSSVSTDIGHSIMALTAGQSFNYEPIKIPLALFTESHQERLIRAAEKHGRENLLVQMPIANAQRQYGQPVKYLEEVISSILPDNMRKMTQALLSKIKEIEGKVEAIEATPDYKSDLKLIGERHNMKKQVDFLNLQISKINEAVLIGKANDWLPSKTMEYAKNSITEITGRAKEVVKEQKRQAYPEDIARAEVAGYVDKLIAKLFKFMEDAYTYTR